MLAEGIRRSDIFGCPWQNRTSSLCLTLRRIERTFAPALGCAQDVAHVAESVGVPVDRFHIGEAAEVGAEMTGFSGTCSSSEPSLGVSEPTYW